MFHVGYRTVPVHFMEVSPIWESTTEPVPIRPSQPGPPRPSRGYPSGGNLTVLVYRPLRAREQDGDVRRRSRHAVGATMPCRPMPAEATKRASVRERGMNLDSRRRPTCRPPLARWRNPMSGLQQVPSPTEASVDHPVIPRGRRRSSSYRNRGIDTWVGACFTPATCPLGRDDHVTHSPRASRRCRPVDDRRLGFDLHARGAVPGRPVITAVGDIACQSYSQSDGEGACRSDEVAALITDIAPDRFLALGDLQYNNGKLEEFLRVYDQQFGHLNPITMPTPGNHEYGTEGGAGVLRLLGRRRTDPRVLLVQPRRVARRVAELRHLPRRPRLRAGDPTVRVAGRRPRRERRHVHPRVPTPSRIRLAPLAEVRGSWIIRDRTEGRRTRCTSTCGDCSTARVST